MLEKLLQQYAAEILDSSDFAQGNQVYLKYVFTCALTNTISNFRLIRRAKKPQAIRIKGAEASLISTVQ